MKSCTFSKFWKKSEFQLIFQDVCTEAKLGHKGPQRAPTPQKPVEHAGLHTPGTKKPGVRQEGREGQAKLGKEIPKFDSNLSLIHLLGPSNALGTNQGPQSNALQEASTKAKKGTMQMGI